MCADIVFSLESEFEFLGITVPIKLEVSIGKADEIEALYYTLTTEEAKTAFYNLLKANSSNALANAVWQERENRDENMDSNEERRDSDEKTCDPMAQREE